MPIAAGLSIAWDAQDCGVLDVRHGAVDAELVHWKRS
jgi:hypothetical protein